MRMKAITLLQPWASLVVLGEKTLETRSWATRHRGPLLIHAGRSLPEENRLLCGKKPFATLLRRHGIRFAADLPRGVILGSVELLDCLSTQEFPEKEIGSQAELGDFGPGRWVWKLANPH